MNRGAPSCAPTRPAPPSRPPRPSLPARSRARKEHPHGVAPPLDSAGDGSWMTAAGSGYVARSLSLLRRKESSPAPAVYKPHWWWSSLRLSPPLSCLSIKRKQSALCRDRHRLDGADRARDAQRLHVLPRAREHAQAAQRHRMHAVRGNCSPGLTALRRDHGSTVAGSQGLPSWSMVRTSNLDWPCLAAVDR